MAALTPQAPLAWLFTDQAHQWMSANFRKPLGLGLISRANGIFDLKSCDGAWDDDHWAVAYSDYPHTPGSAHP